jgi:hypothetical protein
MVPQRKYGLLRRVAPRNDAEGLFLPALQFSRCRPRESGDPERERNCAHRAAAASRFGAMGRWLYNDKRRWLWVPAFAGTTSGGTTFTFSNSPTSSLPGLTRQSILFEKRSLRRWMDARIKSGHDTLFVDTVSRSRRASRASFTGKFLSSETRGRREYRAPDAPDSRVCNDSGRTHTR